MIARKASTVQGIPVDESAGQFRYTNPYLHKKEVPLCSSYRFKYTGVKSDLIAGSRIPLKGKKIIFLS